MKIIFILTLTLTILLCIPEKIEKTYVNASSGLILREKPSINSKKILLIPDHSEINIISETTITEEINGNRGKWVKVEFKSSIGYVFDYYLLLKSEQLILRNEFCNKSDYKLQVLNKSISQKQNKNNSKRIINGQTFFELSLPNSTKKIYNEVQNILYSSSYFNESFYGNFNQFDHLLVTKWDETVGDFQEIGYNLYFTNEEPIQFINFYPENQNANCVYSLVASYAYPKVKNIYMDDIIISHVSYPNCDFENPPENLIQESTISKVPKSFKRNSFLVLKFNNKKLSFNEFCDNNLPVEYEENLEKYKALNFQPF
jgi:hypothetical protein